MSSTILWQRETSGYVETEILDGTLWVTCYADEEPLPPAERVTDGLQVLYTFEEGSGGTVHDVSEVDQPLDLVAETEAAISWLVGGGLAVNSSTILMSAGAASKVIAAVMESNEVTVEAWIKPLSETQTGPARIVALSSDYHHRNFHLAQSGEIYDLRLRTTETTDNGRPSITTPLGVVHSELTQVVYTRAPSGRALVYVDGEVVAEQTVGGSLANWDEGHPLVLANELAGNRAWLGEFHLIAFYSRALGPAEVVQNHEAGVHRQ